MSTVYDIKLASWESSPKVHAIVERRFERLKRILLAYGVLGMRFEGPTRTENRWDMAVIVGQDRFTIQYGLKNGQPPIIKIEGPEGTLSDRASDGGLEHILLVAENSIMDWVEAHPAVWWARLV
jgi:hypothetical protein